jgi:hypothetical protein
MWLCESREASVRPAGPAPRMAIRGAWVFGAIVLSRTVSRLVDLLLSAM